MNAPFRPAPTTLESAVRVVGQHPLLPQLKALKTITEGPAFGQCDYQTTQALDRVLTLLIDDAEYEDNRLAALITNGRSDTWVYL